VALPGPEMLDRLQRYETGNDRHFQRVLDRLNKLQTDRRDKGAARRKPRATSGATE
jgi:hypothetical protein